MSFISLSNCCCLASALCNSCCLLFASALMLSSNALLLLFCLEATSNCFCKPSSFAMASLLFFVFSASSSALAYCKFKSASFCLLLASVSNCLAMLLAVVDCAVYKAASSFPFASSEFNSCFLTASVSAFALLCICATSWFF